MEDFTVCMDAQTFTAAKALIDLGLGALFAAVSYRRLRTRRLTTLPAMSWLLAQVAFVAYISHCAVDAAAGLYCAPLL